MGKDYLNNRPRGNLLPKTKVTPEHPTPCMKFTMDIEHYNRTGEIIPLTEPEEFVPPEDGTKFVDWVANQNTYNEEDEAMGRRTIEHKPTKEELEADEKVLTNLQIMEKYNVSKSTVKKWIHDFGIQRIAIEKEEEEEPEGTEAPETEVKAEPEPEPVIPSMEEYEKFFTDVPAKEEPIPDGMKEYQVNQMKDNCTEQEAPEDPDEKIWQNVEIEIKIIRARVLSRAEREFHDRLLKLFECC